VKSYRFEITETGTMPVELIGAFVGIVKDVLPGMYEVVVRKPNRTGRQNRYLHAIFNQITKIMRDAGVVNSDGEPFTTRTWKIYYCDKYLDKTVTEKPNGEVAEVRVSTSDLSTKAFAELVDSVRADETLISRGVIIPSPEDWHRGNP